MWLKARVLRANNSGQSYNVHYEDDDQKEFGLPPAFVRWRRDGSGRPVSTADGAPKEGAAAAMMTGPSHVALKQFKQGGAQIASYPILLAFQREYRAMKALNKLGSPFLVKMLSAALPHAPATPLLCLEYCDGGDLTASRSAARGHLRRSAWTWQWTSRRGSAGRGWLGAPRPGRAQRYGLRGDTSSGVGAYGTPSSTPPPARQALRPQPALLGEGRFGCGDGLGGAELPSAVEGDKVEVGTSATSLLRDHPLALPEDGRGDGGGAAAAAAVDLNREQQPPAGVSGRGGREEDRRGQRGRTDHSPDLTVADMGKLLDDSASEPTARPTAADAVARLVQFTSGCRWSRPRTTPINTTTRTT